MGNAMMAMLLGLLLSLGSPLAFSQEMKALSETDMALGYYQPLAEQGEPYAQLTIGEIYMEGAGVQQDLVHAYAWFAASHAQGVQEAEVIMEHVLGKLSSAERQQALLLADEFIAAYTLQAR